MSSNKDYVVVTTVSQFRIRYVMHKDELQNLNTEHMVEPIEWANDTVTLNECEEFSQEHLGETIMDSRMISEEEMIELFDKENDYLKEWSTEQKIKWVKNSLITK